MFQDNEVLKTPININNGNISVNIESLFNNIQLLYNNKKLRNELIKNTTHYKKHLMNIKDTTAQTASFYEKIFDGMSG